MKLIHNVSFVGSPVVITAGEEVTKEQEKMLKDSGMKYHELKEKKASKKKE